MSVQETQAVQLTSLEAFMLHNALQECADAFADNPKATEQHRAAIRSTLLKLEDTFGTLEPLALA